MDYKSEYNKYKKRYLKLKTNNKKKLFQMGGDFQVDEEDFYADGNINKILDKQIDELKYIAGPVKMTILCGPFNKIVYLIGDIHIHTNKGFICGPNDEKQSLYFPEYMLRLIKKNSSNQFDIFVELPYHHTKRSRIMKEGMIQNINELFNFCFTNLYDKEKCQTFFPNARFHAMDIRWYAGELSEGSDYIKVFTSFRNIIDKFIDNEEVLLRFEILELLVYNIQQIDEYKTQINITEQDFITSSLELIGETLSFENTIKIYTWIYDIIKGIDDDTVLKFKDNYIELSKLLTKKLEPEYINFIKEFMGDENGLYDDIDQRFWKLIERSDKLNRNFSSLTPKDREYVKLYYSTLIREFKEEYKKDIDPIINNISTKEEINFSDINKLSDLLHEFAVMIMDIYILGRLFKEYVQNSIIIAGRNHTDKYEDILKNIGYKVIFSKDIYKMEWHERESGHPDLYSKRCIDVSDAQFIKEERLPNCV